MGIFGPKQCHKGAVQVLLHFHLTQSATFRAQAQYARYSVQELEVALPLTILSINQAVQY